MGRPPFSSYSPKVAAKMRLELSEGIRKAWSERDKNGFGTRKNGSLLTETQEKISKSVSKLWDEGAYDKRVNGMLGRTGVLHHNYTWGKRNFREILGQFEPKQCRFCGEKDLKIDCHHMDENCDNYLLTNLFWACVPCHSWKFHYGDRKTRTKTPFITLTRKESFEYAHILPWHPGKCSQLHGHSGHLEIKIRGRIDPNSVVMDFGDLKKDIRVSVIDVLDHKLLNDFIPNATSEALLLWVWQQLESVGVKGLVEISFAETDGSLSSISYKDILEAYGWHKDKNEWGLVLKMETLDELGK